MDKSSCREPTPPQPGNYFRCADDLSSSEVDRGVVLYCRVSNRSQYKGGQRLSDYERYCIRELERRGIRVIKTFKETNSGWLRDDRSELKRAIKCAEEHGVPLVTLSPDRFLRPETYHSSRHKDVIPTEEEFDSFREMTGSVVVATILRPDASPKEVERVQQQIGQEASTKRNGRPPKNSELQKQKTDWSKLCWGLFLGYSVREIARHTGRSESTLRGWLKPRELMTAPPLQGRPKKN